MLERCEVPGCPNRAAWTHHIVNQGIQNSQGCDCDVNRIDLCDDHHKRVHALGRWTFFRKVKLLARLKAALAHRNERNRGGLPCSPEWTRKVGTCAA